MKNIITKEIEYMKYVLGYKRGVVISEQLTPEQKAKLDADAKAASDKFKTIEPVNTTQPDSTTPTSKTKPVVPFSAANMTTVYNFAIGQVTELQSQNKIGSVDASAAKAWLIFNRDLVKNPTNKDGIEILSKNYQTGVSNATNILNITKKYSSTNTLPADTINIGVDYIGATVTTEKSDFGIGSSAKYKIDFTRTSDKKS